MIAPATAMILGLVGAAMCFVLNTAYAAVNNYIEIDKSRTTGESAKANYNELLLQFVATDNEPVKKQLYLDMKQAMATSAYQERLIHHQKLKLIHALVVDVLVPPLVFVSFMFMPFGIGLAVLAAGFALAVISHYILKDFAPEADKLPALDLAEYADFARLEDPKISDINMPRKSDVQETSTFFSLGRCASDAPPSYDSLSEITPELVK